MSIDLSMAKNKRTETNRDSITWKVLIKDTETQISEAEMQIRRLRRSLRFFKKKDASGDTFPKKVCVQKE